MMKAKGSTFGATSLVVLALVLTGYNIRARVTDPRKAVSTIDDWRAYANGARIGPRSASVTIIEFVDYACTACRALAPHVNTALAAYPSDVALVIRHFPFISPESFTAASAAICADRSGRFREYHTKLLSSTVLTLDSLVAYARQSGIDNINEMRACIASESTARILASDTLAATTLQVNGTPTTYINGRKYVGRKDAIGEAIGAAVQEQIGR